MNASEPASFSGVTYTKRTVGAFLCSSAYTARASAAVCADDKYAAGTSKSRTRWFTWS